jgi:hypothetical protein
MPCVSTYLLEDTFTFSKEGISSSKPGFLSTIHVLLQQRRGVLHHDEELEAVSTFINIYIYIYIYISSCKYKRIHLSKNYNLTAYIEMFLTTNNSSREVQIIRGKETKYIL